MRRLVLQMLVVSLAACGEGGTASRVRILASSVVANPLSTLSAFVIVETSAPCQVRVEFGADTAHGSRTGLSAAGTMHRIPLVGLRAETGYHLRPVAVPAAGDEVPGEDLVFTTGALPAWLPELTVSVHDQERMAGGLTLVCPKSFATNEGGCVAVDPDGEVVWYYDFPDRESGVQGMEVEPFGDGDLLVTATGLGFRVISIGGELVADFPATPAGLLQPHHDAIPLPGGHVLALYAETRQVEVPWRPEPITARGDVVVELDLAGDVWWRWSAFDHLDSERYPDALSMTGEPHESYDWTHGNALQYLAADDRVLVSLRNQHWIVTVDRRTGEVLWRLGDEGDFELLDRDPDAGVDWFNAQHAPELQPDGRLALFDNGNTRVDSSLGQRGRAVIYDLDLERRTATQSWQYPTGRHTPVGGDADRLPNGNVLICVTAPEGSEPSRVVEVTGTTPAEVVWSLEVPEHGVYRATRLGSFWWAD